MLYTVVTLEMIALVLPLSFSCATPLLKLLTSGQYAAVLLVLAAVVLLVLAAVVLLVLAGGGGGGGWGWGGGGGACRAAGACRCRAAAGAAAPRQQRCGRESEYQHRRKALSTSANPRPSSGDERQAIANLARPASPDLGDSVPIAPGPTSRILRLPGDRMGSTLSSGRAVRPSSRVCTG